MRRAIAGLLLPLLLAGCAGQRAAGPDGSPSPSSRERLEVSETPTYQGDGPLENPGPQVLDDLSVLPDGRTVTVRYLGGDLSCFGATHAIVEYRPDRVILTLFTGAKTLPPPSGDTYYACTAIGIEKEVAIQLSQPVGTRPIVDGAAESTPTP